MPGNPPPFESKSGENKGGVSWVPLQKNFTPFWRFPLVKSPFGGPKIAKIFRLRRAFPLRNHYFRGPKPQNFLACGAIPP